MGTYETIIVVLFFLLTIVLGSNGIKTFRQGSAEQDKKQRTAIRRKALLFMASGLMFFLGALYIIFRVSWFMLIAVMIGYMAMGYVIGSGVRANMKHH